MSLENDDERLDSLVAAVKDIAKTVAGMIDTQKTLLAMSRSNNAIAIEILDFACLSNGGSVAMLGYLNTLPLPLEESARRELNEIVSKAQAAHKELDAKIIGLKMRCGQIVPPLPPPAGA